MKTETPKRTLRNALPYLLVIFGIIGIICSAILISDQISVWQNPNFHPICDLNPVVSCGSVINSKQGHIFNIPAPFFGLLAFPVLVTIGVAMWAGARFKRWFWVGLELGAVGGVIFALWLFWLSVYRVHALCPFCLTTDVAVYTVAWYLTLYNLDQGHIRLPNSLKSVEDYLRRHHLDILLVWFLALFIFIMHHFWYYYGKHL